MAAGSALLSWMLRDSTMLRVNLNGSTTAADCFRAALPLPTHMLPASSRSSSFACYPYKTSSASCAVLSGPVAPVVSTQLWEHPQQQRARLLPVHWDGGRQLLLWGACRKRHGSSSGSGTTLHRSSTLHHTACHLELHHFESSKLVRTALLCCSVCHANVKHPASASPQPMLHACHDACCCCCC
jgi:hypothetical protein